jgi:hypothetical protein
MCCVCASVCGAGHAHLRGWDRPTSPHALPRGILRCLYMWVPRGGDFLTHPGRYGSKERDQSPRAPGFLPALSGHGERIAGSNARPSQWAHGATLSHPYTTGYTAYIGGRG